MGQAPGVVVGDGGRIVNISQPSWDGKLPLAIYQVHLLMWMSIAPCPKKKNAEVADGDAGVITAVGFKARYYRKMV